MKFIQTLLRPILLLFVTLTFISASTAFAQGAGLEAGRYVGAYDCNLGRSYNYAVVEVFPNNGSSQGRVSFESGTVAGAYLFTVEKAANKFILVPTVWERQPKGYFFTRIELYHVGSDLAGRVAANGCGRIYLARDRTSPPTAASAEKLKAGGFQMLEAEGYNYGTIAPAGYSGLPHPYDETRATGHYEQACNAGLVGGCLGLANALKKGRAVPADPDRANTLFTAMCKNNFETACHEVVLRPETLEYKPGSKVTLTLSEMQKRYQQQCFAGSSVACTNLSASLFSTSNQEVRNYGRFVAEQGCRLKDRVSCYNVGSFYDNDDTMPNNQEKARAFFGTACNLGDIDSCSELRARDRRAERANRVVNRNANPMTCVVVERNVGTVRESIPDLEKREFREVTRNVDYGFLVRNKCGGEINVTTNTGASHNIMPTQDDFFINLYFASIGVGERVVAAEWVLPVKKPAAP